MNIPTRREFIKTTGQFAAAAALAGTMIPKVHAAENNTLRLALIGCGGRGTGAVRNALSVPNVHVKLTAMADVFQDRLAGSHERLLKQFGRNVDVPPDRRFIGFDAYRAAMDCLAPGDVAIFASPPAFRWVHFGYAIAKGLHVFMEKPTTVDGPSTRKMLALAAESEKKGLKVGVGLMARHCPARLEMIEQFRGGRIGEIIALRTYRMHGPVGSFASRVNPGEMSDLHYQIRRFHGFLWASGGAYSDFYIHNIDECCWFKDAWPVSAQALGGRHYRGDFADQNFDTYSVEYAFADGTKLFLSGRSIEGCANEFSSFVHGTKGMSYNSGPGQAGKCCIYKAHNAAEDEIVWKSSPRPENSYQTEWNLLIDAIRNDKPYNEARRGAEASLVSSMGRMAAHTGQIVTYDQILNHDHEFAPDVDKLTLDSPAPLPAGPDGKYPVPQPGIVTTREY
ncbi:MAG: Gfo/Idh/MocA family oxidoreductase [Pirellulaceae bacterium]|nr:Gfo/Idh/MocA family oxidoreductase [Pirellulaceae bacterium]